MIALAAQSGLLLEEMVGQCLDEVKSYQRNAKVVLTGSGAAEHSKGYSRHRVPFQIHNLEGLNKEIEMELGQISYKNLDCNDRVIDDHGKEAFLS